MSGRYNCVATSSEDAHLYDPTCIEVLRQPGPCAFRAVWQGFVAAGPSGKVRSSEGAAFNSPKREPWVHRLTRQDWSPEGAM